MMFVGLSVGVRELTAHKERCIHWKIRQSTPAKIFFTRTTPKLMSVAVRNQTIYDFWRQVKSLEMRRGNLFSKSFHNSMLRTSLLSLKFLTGETWGTVEIETTKWVIWIFGDCKRPLILQGSSYPLKFIAFKISRKWVSVEKCVILRFTAWFFK